MKTSTQTLKSLSSMVVLTLLAKLLGFYKEALIASRVGSSSQADTLFIALAAISLLTTLITLSVSNASVPLFSKLKSPLESLNKLIFPLFLISLIATLMGYLFAPQWISVMASGFDTAQSKEAQVLLRLGLPVVLFSSSIGLLTGFLQSQSKVIYTSLLQIPFNGLIILYLYFLYPIGHLKGILLTTIVATALQLCILSWALIRNASKPKIKFVIKSDILSDLLKLMVPIIMSIAIIDINKIVDKTLASSLPAGRISALNYASRLNDILLSVFVLTLATAVFPMLSKAIVNHNSERVKHLIHKGIDIVLMIAIPATFGLILLSTPIIRVCFERGAFGSDGTHLTSTALQFYTFGLIPMALRLLLEKVFFALEDTKTPMKNGFLSVIVNVLLNLIFIRFMGHNGLALATSIAAWVTSGLLVLKLRKKLGHLGFKKISMNTGLYFASSLFMSLGIVLSQPIWEKYFTSHILDLLATILSGTIIYFLCLLIIKPLKTRLKI